MNQSKTAKKQLSFGEMFDQLERITKELESDSLDLDIAIEKFERGFELAQALKAKLQSSEQRVEKIRQKFESLEVSDDDGDEQGKQA